MLARLEEVVAGLGPVAVAVSGGVDSVTLAQVAHCSASSASMYHAVSAAVPAAATERVQRISESSGWDLHLIDAGEFDDPTYMANPVDRCFHCKANLYGTIRSRTDATVLSGTNTDDLTDYRPGLDAAKAELVIHPFVEAGITKAGVRAIAEHIGLSDVADLPSAPCLSSRIETGLAIQPKWLRVIEAVESELTDDLSPINVRCRVRHDRVAVELDEDTLASLSPLDAQRIIDRVSRLWAAAGVGRPVSVEPYRMGSAFLRVRS